MGGETTEKASDRISDRPKDANGEWATHPEVPSKPGQGFSM